MAKRRNRLWSAWVLAMLFAGEGALSQCRADAEIGDEKTAPAADPIYTTILDSDTADDLWAKALWIALPMNDGTSEEIARLFTAALERSESKAPIYTSFAETDSGPARLNELLNAAVAEFLGKAKQGLKAQGDVESKDLQESFETDPEWTAQKVAQLWQQSISKAARAPELANRIDDMLKTMNHGTDASSKFWLAAIAEDPTYMRAWCQLCMHSEGELQETAFHGFMQHDPENAVPYYIQSIFKADEGKYDTALKLLNEGNQKPKCQWYLAALPTTFSLRYTNHEPYLLEHGVAGQPIPPLAFRVTIEQIEEPWTQMAPFPGDLNDLIWDVYEHAKSELEQGRTESAISYAEALTNLGFQLLRTEPRDLTYVIWAQVALAKSIKLLRSAYPQTGRDADLRELGPREVLADLLAKELKRAVGRDDPKPTGAERRIKVTMLLRGEYDPNEIKRNRLDRLHSRIQPFVKAASSIESATTDE